MERWVVAVVIVTALLYTLQPYAAVRLRVEWHGWQWARRATAAASNEVAAEPAPGADTQRNASVAMRQGSSTGQGTDGGSRVCDAGVACASGGVKVNWPADPDRMLLVSDSLTFTAYADADVATNAFSGGKACLCAWFTGSTTYVTLAMRACHVVGESRQP